MSSYIHYEMLLFLQSVSLGILLVLFYDLLVILRNLIPHHMAVVGIEDFLFWISAGMLVFIRIYMTNQGILRDFLFIGIGLGALLCHYSISPVFVKTLTGIFVFPVRIAKKMINRLIFVCRSCKIYVYNYAKTHFKYGKKTTSRKRKGKKFGKEKP
jgi:hypothetical protein